MRPMAPLLAAIALTALAPSASARPLPVSPLDGRWTWTWTRAELLGRGDDPADAAWNAGTHHITLSGGRFVHVTRRGESRGSFSVRRDVVTFISDNRYGGMRAGLPYSIRFSLYRDHITFRDLPGRGSSPLRYLALAPWTRAH